MNPAPLFRLCVWALFWAITPWARAGDPPPEPDPRLDLPVLQDQLDQKSHPAVETECSPTKARTPVGRLSWSPGYAPLEMQRVDLTVFKRGFDQGFYSLVWPLSSGQMAQISATATLLARKDPSMTPTLESIEAGSGSNLAIFEDLEPGLIYEWRICTLTEKGWVPSEVASATIPVCPADFEEEKEGEQ